MANFTIDDIDEIAENARDLWAGKDTANNRLYHLLIDPSLPQLVISDYLSFNFDPFSTEYKNQVLNLWKLLDRTNFETLGGGYDPELHELDAAADADPVKFPGFYNRRDVGAVHHASYEIAMIADILQFSKLTSSGVALEYGAGSGNIAICLSRLGVEVDTVDISKNYCNHIKLNSDFYGTKLHAYNEEFGYNPRGMNFKYDAIIFHACVHHCIEHNFLIDKLAKMIGDSGVILLSNEPIHVDFYLPWGLKRDPEAVSVISARGWMELGFRESYLFQAFLRGGLLLKRIVGNFSNIPLYSAQLIASKIGPLELFDYIPFIKGGFLPENDGIWSGSSMTIDLHHNNDRKHYVVLANRFSFAKVVTIGGGILEVIRLQLGQILQLKFVYRLKLKYMENVR